MPESVGRRFPPGPAELGLSIRELLAGAGRESCVDPPRCLDTIVKLSSSTSPRVRISVLSCSPWPHEDRMQGGCGIFCEHRDPPRHSQGAAPAGGELSDFCG